jgi:signal transduction histidine kinase/CheY-like chemotaxis protein/HPt (histidine-containing phosphotransfer) domain-containing protein
VKNNWFSLENNSFNREMERAYTAQRIQAAIPMLRFLFWTAGLLPLILIVQDAFFFRDRFDATLIPRLGFFGFWLTITYLAFYTKFRLNIQWALKLFALVGTSTACISNILIYQSNITDIVPLTLFFLFSAVISQIGVWVTIKVSIVCTLVPLLFILIAPAIPSNAMTAVLMLTFWSVLAVIASRILEKRNRKLYLAEQEVKITRDLTEDLLNQAFKANEAKSRFLANMSHEIRTPLTSIIGYADASQTAKSIEETSETMQVIKRNSEHLLAIINDILDLSKIEAEQVELHSKPYPLFEMLHNIASEMSRESQENGLEFKVNFQFPLPEYIYGDCKRVKQVLVKLIENAVKFTESGCICLDLAVDTYKKHITFRVRDTGIGMTEDEIDSVFLAFTQADSSASRKYGGAGLGLHLSNELVLAMKGTITVKSQVGHGSTFTVQLPLELPSDTTWHEMVPTHVCDATSVNPFTKYQGEVLLVEDNIDNQKLIKALLIELGINVVTADDGHQAVETVMQQEFDLVLMDIQMPVLDGLKAIKAIRTSGLTVPIVALTANVLNEEIAAYEQAGFDGHIAKPIDRQKFLNTIDRFLDVNEHASEPPSLVELNSGEYLRLKEAFIENVRSDYPQMVNAMAAEDWALLQRLVHSIKGAAGNYGFMTLTNKAEKLERQLLAEDYGNLYSNWIALCDEIESVTL